MDKFQGEGGSFEMRNGERVQTAEPSAPHPDGDRARDADGKPVDPKAPDPTENALPKPGPAPWVAPDATPSVTGAAPSVSQAPDLATDSAGSRRTKKGE